MTYGPSAGAKLATTPAHGHDDAPYQPVFTGAARDELETLCARYPSRQAALLPALWMIQEARGWVSDGAVEEVAQVLGVSAAHVRGVLTFYTMYHQHPVGKHFIQVCTTTPCNLCGAEDVVNAFLRHTGCGELGVTSDDGRFTVIEVECLGACGFATPVMINSRFLESVTPDSVPDVLEECD
ncbi:MAG: NADH-quinone oxidoreductase subunit NuoE [Gemmatimonadota bacterium]